MKQFDINSIQVAKPCPELWEDMVGDGRVRKCSSCRLKVLNLSAMTVPEIEAILKSPSGRTCIRLYRRADGSVITKDCPKGVRAYRRRIARFAAAVVASIVSLASFSAAQGTKKLRNAVQSSATILQQDRDMAPHGTITDSAGAVVPGAQVILLRHNSRKPVAEVKSDGEGKYSFKVQKAGLYRLEVRIPGFKTAILENVSIGARQSKAVDVSLEPSEESVVVGIFWEEQPIDARSNTVTKSISNEQIQRIPF